MARRCAGLVGLAKAAPRRRFSHRHSAAPSMNFGFLISPIMRGLQLGIPRHFSSRLLHTSHRCADIIDTRLFAYGIADAADDFAASRSRASFPEVASASRRFFLVASMRARTCRPVSACRRRHAEGASLAALIHDEMMARMFRQARRARDDEP